MARGQQKLQAQAKNAAKQQKMKGGESQKAAQAGSLKITCPLCFTPMTNYGCLTQHYDAKHPKEKCPTKEEIGAA